MSCSLFDNYLYVVQNAPNFNNQSILYKIKIRKNVVYKFIEFLLKNYNRKNIARMKEICSCY